ncbi:unnamed protein product [Rotaria sordida]|uniref:Ubiquitin-like modifier-activating enzyme ATG7 n=1 Tax=Rotaria sordida TaxID=392033 RepID=A0A813WA11_9BILA|nr:unnamed protein product [Rotaria sordida]CAF0913477.1 unnamed protein product [Rotaria sordida]
MTTLKFTPYSSALDTGFWHELTRRKLDIYRLDSSDRSIYGYYSNDANDNMPALFNVDHRYFDENNEISNQQQQYSVNGTLKLVNTIEEFKTFDIDSALKSESNILWNDFIQGNTLENPQKLNRFYLLIFADLKKYIYYYWFAFPTFLVPTSFYLLNPIQSIGERFSIDEITAITKTLESNQLHACCLHRQENLSFSIVSLKQAVQYLNKQSQLASEYIFIVNDPSTDPIYPGWPVRNLLTLLYYHLCSVEQLNIICWRERFRDGHRYVNHSLYLQLKPESISNIGDTIPSSTGWEKNERQRLGSRQVNLSTSMNPIHLAETAVGLNLKLMKWRLAPEIDLETLEKTRCLLLGAGTLGCNVARCLMGWGIKHITFVDNSRISYSNPVRQTLFTFQDSCENKPKAQAAADALKIIYPGIKSTGYDLTIPMPGHTVGDSTMEKVKEDVNLLHDLIRQHDVIFLLTDSRESRWLPTVIGAVEQKIVLCCAVGFDSYVIIRHGIPTKDLDSSSSSTTTYKNFLPGHKLGCYFCNDIVAPGDSSIDRTLDQQCTVTRPGISMMASALSVELLVSIIQHPLRGQCPASIHADHEESIPETVSCLGIVPHTIRSFLSRYSTVLPTGEAFSQCVACSSIVRKAFEDDGFSFLLQVFNDLNYLENLTGLRAMQLATDLNDIIELSDDEEI